MKILEHDQKHEEIVLKVDNLNDLWSLYNVISKNDKVGARTHRRVVLKEGSKGQRKPMWLKLKVEAVSFHEFSNRLRVKGTILEGPEDFVSFGTYHTLNIEIGQKITIIKDKWLRSELNRLNKSSKFESVFIMIIIAIETGLACIELITNFSHNRIARVKKSIPGKRYEQSHRNKALMEFFDDVKVILEENLKKHEVNAIIICGPGNTRDLLVKYIKENSKSPHVSKIRSLHASSGTESAILEILKSKKLVKLKDDVKVLQEAEKIEEIFTLFSNDPDLIAIGLNELSVASKQGAVATLFIVDILIRGSSKEEKLKIEEIITSVEKSGGSINILSSEHPTGQQIADLGSIVGILRYKL